MSEFKTSRDDRYFEDYEPGAVYELGSISVSQEQIIEFAKVYDPQSFHIDPEAAAKGPFGGIIASGWQTVSLLMRLFVDGYLSSVASRASPGVDELRWVAPVRPGVPLHLRVTTLDKRISKSKPDRGIVTSRLDGLSPEGEVLVTMRALNMMALRHPG